MTARVITVMPLLIATALFALATGAWFAAGLIAIGALTTIAVGARVNVSKFAQRATVLMVIILSALLGETLLVRSPGVGPTGLNSFWGTVALLALLVTLIRRFFTNPEGGARADFAVLAIALAACGEKRIGVAYTVTAVAFMASVLASLRAQNDTRIWWRILEGNAPLGLLALLAISAAATAASMVVLPRLEQFTQHQFERVLFSTESRTGFTGRVRLGVPDKILESDQMVMRVYGPHTDYLRGAVYDRFDRSGWDMKADATFVPITTAKGPVLGDDVTEIRVVGDGSDRDRGLRYFLPLGARRIGTARGVAMVDVLGTMRPPAGQLPTPVYFEANVGEGDLRVLAPSAEDVQVPEGLATSLTGLAEEWTQEAHTPKQKLLALERHLTHEFKYSLEGVLPSGSHVHEPAVIHFLLHSRQGHCEYFATAMALLARSLKIPARVVGGYRVAEHNALGNYDVVREKNAHAWVEAWVLGEGWRTYEPTPTTEANATHQTSSAGAFGDWIAAAWDRALDAVARASLTDLVVVLAVAVALLIVVRRLRAGRERAKDAAVEHLGGRPLACLTRLESALAHRGEARVGSESLERYARRLAKTSFADASQLIEQYCAYRYGGVGEETQLTALLDGYVAQLGARPKERS